jgi:hypothetical protein
MKNVPVLDELRDIRRRLTQEQEFDVERYAAMLREVELSQSRRYLTQPILPAVLPQRGGDIRHAG